ncbi:InlB B-repeat-containing protein [Clostridium sp. MCC353]|uniref:InlB B-repeat-containing protein n=1 Tax=Clostridium sp. MCC353 TaxID=2592646 RepID=UPI002079AC0A|nr:InlB B-repeat-containing protein [Clostridium sp. MCC353]
MPLGSTGDRTLFEPRQEVGFVVTYTGNDEGGPPAENVPPPQQVRVGERETLSEQRPTREGYVFAGWNTDPFGGGTAYQPGDDIYVTSDLTLYAQWEAAPPAVHLITYEPNGPSVEGLPDQQEVSEGETVSLSAAVPTRTGYRFLNWNSQPDGSGTAYQPGQTAGPLYADLTLYAQWEAIPPTFHLLTYEANDAGGPPAQWIPFPQQVPEGQIISLSDAVPTREGYLFTGWNTLPDGSGTSYQPGGAFGPIFSDASLYAQWIAQPQPCYTLTYCGNDAGGPPARCIPSPERILAGQCTRISCSSPCRACSAFTGWNTDPCGRGQMFCPGQTIGPVTGDICLYAQWRRLPPPKPVISAAEDLTDK